MESYSTDLIYSSLMIKHDGKLPQNFTEKQQFGEFIKCKIISQYAKKNNAHSKIKELE